MPDRTYTEWFRFTSKALTADTFHVLRFTGTKQPFIGLNLDADSLDAMRAIKNALDPLGIMNPGKIFPGEG